MKTNKIKDLDTLRKRTFDVDTNEVFNLGLNFRQRIGNFALSVASEHHIIEWDDFSFLIKFKDEKKKLYQAKFDVIFYKKGNIVYSVGGISLQKHTYKPFFNKGTN